MTKLSLQENEVEERTQIQARIKIVHFFIVIYIVFSFEQNHTANKNWFYITVQKEKSFITKSSVVHFENFLRPLVKQIPFLLHKR